MVEFVFYIISTIVSFDSVVIAVAFVAAIGVIVVVVVVVVVVVIAVTVAVVIVGVVVIVAVVALVVATIVIVVVVVVIVVAVAVFVVAVTSSPRTHLLAFLPTPTANMMMPSSRAAFAACLVRTVFSDSPSVMMIAMRGTPDLARLDENIS